MLNSDDLQERQRLAETYAAMTDDELLKLASNPEALTETAWETLEDELDRRHLELPPEPAERPAHIDFRMLATIRQFRDLPEALLAKGSLESMGIQCFLRDDNLVRLDWLWSNLVGGVKLKVEPSEAESAMEILNQSIPEKIDVAGIGEYEQPHCPNCQSLDITFKELNRPIAYASLWLNVPIPVHRKAWRCHSCNVEWEDDGQATSPESAG